MQSCAVLEIQCLIRRYVIRGLARVSTSFEHTDDASSGAKIRDKSSELVFPTMKEIKELYGITQKDQLLSKPKEKDRAIIYHSYLDAAQHIPHPHRKTLEGEVSRTHMAESFERLRVPDPCVALKYLNDTDGIEGQDSFSHQEMMKDDSIMSSEAQHQFPFSIYTKSSLEAANSQDFDELDEIEAELKKKASDKEWYLNYGTPDSKIPRSNVPCGGCGAHLHCQDSAIPGYLPHEYFTKIPPRNLSSTLCQRCYFLKHHNVALNVNVPPESYAEIISPIRNKTALILLIVDLVDFPCSFFPTILQIVGHKRPLFIVGNKVDLIPQDSDGYLQRIKRSIFDTLVSAGVSPSNIKDIAVISAKTGYGIEDLITQIHNMWGSKGDIYLLGCTNVGKSSLFNALLQSDLCQVEAVDLVERATVSPWPGTTLNLLKFPILKPAGWMLHERTKRLRLLSEFQKEEEKQRLDMLQSTKNPVYATLIGHLGRTFRENPSVVRPDPFEFKVEDPSEMNTESEDKLDPQSKHYFYSQWCYDTPGTVNFDQIINILTAEELMLTLPKSILNPRTFRFWPNHTYFLAGLARIDFHGYTDDSSDGILITFFASQYLPIVYTLTSDAQSFYDENLGTEVLLVPRDNQKGRLDSWPRMGSTTVQVEGVGLRESAADIVLSSAGWVSVTIPEGKRCIFEVHTPGGRGVFLRQPPMLPFAVNLKGSSVKKTPAFRLSRPYTPRE